MENFANFPDLTCGSLFPGCHLTFFAATFTRIFPFRPFRAGTCQHTRDARGRMDRGDTGTDAGPADRTTRSTPARQQGTTPAARHPRQVVQPADRRRRAPHRENVTRGRSSTPRQETPRNPRKPRGIDPWQVYQGSQEALQKPQQARFYCFPVSRTTAAANAAEGHTRGRLTSGTSPGFQKILFRRRHPRHMFNWCQLAPTPETTRGQHGPQHTRNRRRPAEGPQPLFKCLHGN